VAARLVQGLEGSRRRPAADAAAYFRLPQLQAQTWPMQAVSSAVRREPLPYSVEMHLSQVGAMHQSSASDGDPGLAGDHAIADGDPTRALIPMTGGGSLSDWTLPGEHFHDLQETVQPAVGGSVVCRLPPCRTAVVWIGDDSKPKIGTDISRSKQFAVMVDTPLSQHAQWVQTGAPDGGRHLGVDRIVLRCIALQGTLPGAR